MFAIVGAAGKVGYSTCLKLREAEAPVRAILRDPAKASRLRAIGCEVALADLQDPVALGATLAGVDAVQIILPAPLHDDDAPGDMRRSIESLAQALEQARPGRVLAISDYGAHVDEDIGMPSLFHLFEARLRQLDMPKLFLRSAEHMEGWRGAIPVAAATGVLPSLRHSVEARLPAVSAADVGMIVAELLLGPAAEHDVQIVHAEGPHRYNANDAAAALSGLLGRTITAQAVPRSHWQASLERVISPSVAKLLVDAGDAHGRGGLIEVEAGGEVRQGTTELVDALRPFVPAGALNS